MGMFHVYLLVMFSCVLSVRSCTPGRGSSCTSRVIYGGKLMLLKGNYNLNNKRIVLELPPSTQRKFQNTLTLGIIRIRRRSPYCKDNGNMDNFCLDEGYRQSLCLARNKTANSTWKVETGSRVRGYAYVTVHWKINTVVCNPSYQTLTVELRNGTCKRNGIKNNYTKHYNATANSMMETTIRGLQPDAFYDIILTVRCISNVQPPIYCKSDSKRTEESVPTSPPMKVTAKKVRDNYLIFKWEEPPCEHKNGKITNYDFIFEKNGNQIHNVTPRNRKFVVFNGMQTTDSYSFKVRANTKRGFGDYSKPERGNFKDLPSSSSDRSD